MSGRPDQLVAPVRREISVLVADLSGFTAFVDVTEPEYVFALLGDYHSLIGDAIDGLNGVVIDLAGDQVFVVFGMMADDPESARHAVQAALRIRERSGTLIGLWRKRGQRLDMRIALTTGFATLGTVHAGSRTDYKAIGSTVNIAFKLVHAGGPGQTLATAPVAAVAAEFAEVTPRPDVSVQGVTRNVDVFELRAR